MYYNELNGMNLSALGMGCLRFPTVGDDPNHIDQEKTNEIIDRALEAGVNVFDTANQYQAEGSEKALGKALSRHPRESYYISTKYFDEYGGDMPTVFERELESLQTDYIDFYLLHCLDEEVITEYMDPKKNYLGYMLEQKEKGRIKNIGFSAHASIPTLKKFLDWYDGFDMALVQINYLDWTMLDAKGYYEYLTERGIPLWVMEPMKGGRLSTLTPGTAEILKNANLEASLSSWGFRFLQGLPNVKCVLSGMSDTKQVEDNVKTFEKHNPLSDEEAGILEEVAEKFKGEIGVPCTNCRYCTRHCTQELDIPLLIRAYNELSFTDELWKLLAFGETKGADQCIQCGACAPACPQNIDIPGVMKEIAERTEEFQKKMIWEEEMG